VALTAAEFNRMVAEHGAALYRTAYRMIGDRHEAEDVSRRRFVRPGRAAACSGRAVGTRLAGGHPPSPRGRPLAQAGPPVLLADDAALEVGRAADDPLRDEMNDEIQAALAQLPAELRETLLLVIVAELTHQEAAELLGVPWEPYSRA